MLRNLKIGTRLIIGFILVLAFSITTSILAVLEINNIFTDTKNLYEQPYLISNNLRDIKINALNIRRFMLDIIILNDKQEINLVVNEIDREEKLAVEKFELVRDIYFEDKNDIDDAYTFFLDYKKIRDDIIDLKLAGGTNAVVEIMADRNRKYFSELFGKMQTALDNTEKGANDYFRSAQETKDSVTRFLFSLIVIMVLASLVIAYFITRSITNPLSAIVNNIREIAFGNLSNKRLHESEDEIGQLAASYNNMQEDLYQKATVAFRIAKGDFSAHIIPKGDKDIVAESVNMIASNFDLVVKQAQRVANGDFDSDISISMDNPLMTVLSQMLTSLKEVVAKAKQVAEGDYSGEIVPKSQSDELAYSINKMTKALRIATEINYRQDRLKTAQNELNESMRGDLEPGVMAGNIISYLASFTNSQVGALYIYNDENSLFQITKAFALDEQKLTGSYKAGEGILGQAAIEKRIAILRDLPEDYLRITSGIIDAKPRNILVTPCIFNNKTIVIIELGSVTDYTDESVNFLELVSENIAISVLSSLNRIKLTNLLEITTTQAEELQVQQEELREINEELETQASALKKSEEYLQAQQEELKISNEELEENTRRLEDHKIQMEKQNKDLENARIELEKKASELETTNRYKSEFLANMSHELRTPLNSLLILAQNLMENKEHNLNEQQIESASIIFTSGNDLVNLINDILDLSKIESGKMNITYASYPLTKIESAVSSYFGHIIKEKKLDFKITIDDDLQSHIITDEQRLNQILRNLMSNAIKFTEKGGIHIRVFRPDKSTDLSSKLNGHDSFAISVKDTGVGIPKEKQLEIFEAFQQADGSISRKYGGTGLGLSITRELVKLLGGEIRLSSEPGIGSEFTIYLPVDSKSLNPEPVIKETSIAPVTLFRKSKSVTITDDRLTLSKDKTSILIIEDDINFAKMLIKTCTQKGISFLFADSGEEGIELAKKYLPKGIILDIMLPEMNGWEVLEHLKSFPETRHIPVHIISMMEESIVAHTKGIFGYLTKPVTKVGLDSAFNDLQSYINRKIKKLLIIEDDEVLRNSTKLLLEGKDIHITECGTAKSAFENIQSIQFDCIVLDLGLPDKSGIELLKDLNEQNINIPPVVIYTGREISREEDYQLQQYTRNIIIKGAKSEERLLDETSLFLHRVIDEMPERQKKMMVKLYNKDEVFRDRTILLVDDDMRNVFALTQVLESNHMKVHIATNGKKAVELLDEHENINLILMDIMMPVMNGYEAITQIRKHNKYSCVPIIALTAKAMKEDREKSIAAGANDYLSKPVDINKLFNIMRIWLYQ